MRHCTAVALAVFLAACQIDGGGSASPGDDDMTTVIETAVTDGIAAIELPDDFTSSDFPVRIITMDVDGKRTGERIIRTWEEGLDDDAFDLADDRLELRRHEAINGGRDEELRAFFQKVANDPDADEEDREWARGMLR